ncbi:MAG: DNA replication/repair protein RecF [Cellulomonas sp. 73-92]|uniref:DNA replication/repair protein RecF n=1 Tax=Cellulomonas sp. 73-92 TaxID=1895740 RepID=UPI00092BF2FD|nr:DNA replication/repair protein RecF [Cellulomonas sp. 73-92]OJV80948.1 MAG: DNA replication/repair protein RecF [Cellulomonas sp. 73-92]
MFVSHLALTDFRSYPQVELPLTPGITALVGPNGQGKTNLVEAIGYLATLSSHRVPTDAALVRAGADRAVVGARVERSGRATTVEVEITPGRANRARVNGGSPVRARDVLGILRTVQFAPEDLALVKGDPDGRRRFLDELVVQLRPQLAAVLADYDRVLRQRSALLKTAAGAMRASRGVDLRTLDVWDGKLAAAGARIVVARRSLVAALAPVVLESYAQVSAAAGEARIAYRSSLDSSLDDGKVTPAGDEHLVEAQLLEAMGRLRSKEIERGVSLVGPHRDDLVLTLGDLPAKGYASHGESWSYALALRLGSATLLRGGAGSDEWSGDWGPDGDPVLILDDVFAELDTRRRDRLAELVAPAGQVIVTAAVPGDVPEALAGARVDVMAGEVSRVL